jgi:MarR family transcriptional regulator, organic hydroperoxide resistance regulator
MYYNEDMNITSEQVCQDLVALIGRIKGTLARLAEKYDLTPMQLHAMYAIQNGDITMGKVATTLHCDASNVTGIVDRLVAGHYLTRQEGELDRRTKSLQLTDRGRAAIEDIYSQLPTELGCARLSESECATLHGIATKLIGEVPAKA